MDKEENEFEAKMMAIQEKKKLILAHVKILMRDFERLEAEEDQLETEEFKRTGISSFKFSFEIEISEEDMLKDLVKRTEGRNIKPDKPNQN